MGKTQTFSGVASESVYKMLNLSKAKLISEFMKTSKSSNKDSFVGKEKEVITVTFDSTNIHKLNSPHKYHKSFI